MKNVAACIALLMLAPLGVGVGVSVADAQAPKPAAVRDWSANVTRTAAGAYVLGNPLAKVRLIEFASLTCAHCAAFAGTAYPALRADYIRRGLVSLELRHALRDRADLAASLLARCTGPARYFATMEKLFAAQADWLPAAAADVAPSGDSPSERQAALVATATAGGLPAVAGIAAPAAAACLSNTAEQKILAAMTEDAWGKRKIEGTPAFLINDTPAKGTTWAMIQPQIAAALR